MIEIVLNGCNYNCKYFFAENKTINFNNDFINIVKEICINEIAVKKNREMRKIILNSADMEKQINLNKGKTFSTAHKHWLREFGQWRKYKCPYAEIK